MESYLQACDLWDLVEIDHEDPTVVQIRNNREERKRRYKANTSIHFAEEIYNK